MKNKNSKEFLSDLKEDTLDIIQQVETHLSPIPEEVLNYKPSSKQWNILE